MPPISKINFLPMNKIFSNLVLIIFSVVTISASCKKEKMGIDGLPAATQTGENTFGCMVNEKLFIPNNYSLGKSSLEKSYPLSGLYQYNFQLEVHRRDGDDLSNVYISTYAQLREGLTIPLLEVATQGVASASYVRNGDYYSTTSQNKGEIKITHFNITNRVISGTFSFDAINKKGEIKQIREGRFDVTF